MADDVAGISKMSEGSKIHVVQQKTLTTRTTACTTPKNVSTVSNRSCGLRRPSSPFVSPVMKRSYGEENQEIFSTPKRGKYDKQDHEKVTKTTLSGSLERKSLSSASENGSQSCNPSERLVELLARKRNLTKTIQEKEDSLRKLKLVKMYRTKNDLTQLQALIDKWRTVSQEAAERLLGKIKLDPSPTMGQLLSNLQVDKELIQYSEEDEGFY